MNEKFEREGQILIFGLNKICVLLFFVEELTDGSCAFNYASI